MYRQAVRCALRSAVSQAASSKRCLQKARLPGVSGLLSVCTRTEFPFHSLPHQCRALHSTKQLSTAKETPQTAEEEVGAFTKLIEAMGFTGPLKYNKWKIKIAALRMYTCCVERINYDDFFEKFSLPDTLNSWFLVAQLHVWMCLVRMRQEGRAGKYLCRYVVHSMWEDVEQRGKIMGIESVALKASMKVMTENFYAAIFGFDEGVLSDDRVLAAALWRNLFNRQCEDPRQLELAVEYVRKQVIALVMDLFTDVDLFCDLLEAANKRRVPVYILLDEKNLKYFTEMCNTLDIQTTHISNMRVRSVCGDTYCTKQGKKFTGQVLEKFLIIDCEEVIAGSYSFTWLSSQVHSNMLMHFTGRIVESFDRQFRCLYADSQIVDSLHDPDEDGIPCYSFGKRPPEFMQEKPKERVYSDPSSSCSSNSFSSIKKSPGMGSPAFKLNYKNAYLSPDKKAPSPGLYNPSNQGRKGSGSSGAVESSSDSQAFNPSALRNGGGAVAKISGLGLYETKQNYTPLNPSLGKEQRRPPYTEPEQPGKQKTAPLFSKLTNVLTPGAKEGFTKPPTRNNAAAVSHFKDLSLSESTKTNENKPGYPVVPAPLPADVLPAVRRGEISRNDVKRMTLGHSQLDLVNHYNKMKSKNIYSRFEVKDTPHM